jgi:hypothetical protein
MSPTNFFTSNENLVGASQETPWFIIPDALVVTGIGPSGNAAGIADANGNLVLQANNENLLWHGGCIHRFRSKLGYGPRSLERALTLQQQVTARLNQEPEVLDVDRPCIFLGHAFGWHAYGHLHDSLQRLYFPLAECKAGQWTAVVSRHDRVVGFTDHLSALLARTITEADLLTLGNSHCYRFRKLIYAHAPATLTNFTPESLAWVNDAYRSYFASNKEWPRGIYLSRNHVRPGERGVRNEQAVVDLLSRHGFVVVRGDEPLAEIVGLFTHAGKIVGAHGSLFANTFLCNQNAHILELCPSNRVDVTFRNKLKLTSSYEQILVNADAKHNIEIDLDLLREFLLS